MLVKSSYLITLDPEKPFFENPGLLILDDRIAEIGSADKMEAKHPKEEVLDLTGKCVLPGMVNIHTHFYGAFARGISLAGKPPVLFSQILERLWWKLDKALDEKSIRHSAAISLVDGIRSGVTAYFDHHASPNCVEESLDLIADETETAGVRACLCYETSDRDGDKIARAGIRENTRFIKKCGKKNERLAGLFGLHAALTLSDETLARAVKAGSESGCGFHIHVAEGIEDVDESLSRYGKRVVERLSKNGILTGNSIFAHCIHLNDEEKRMLSKAGCTVAHNPESNLNNAVGFADVLDLLKHGVHVGLGTDGFSQGLWHSLRAASLMPRYLKRDPRVFYGEIFNLLFENSRKASQVFGIPLGILKKGAAADLIAIPYCPPTDFNAGNLYGHLFFGLMERAVSDVICGGRLLLKNGELLTLDEHCIMESARKACPAVWKKYKGN
ncbi:MAG: putative aminohydrolase SsnA [Candidatus Wallbacteria bacterium]|nr:putative aminohydrolase SsnA [Candidatus Wallbacteria bacterium]